MAKFNSMVIQKLWKIYILDVGVNVETTAGIMSDTQSVKNVESGRRNAQEMPVWHRPYFTATAHFYRIQSILFKRHWIKPFRAAGEVFPFIRELCLRKLLAHLESTWFTIVELMPIHFFCLLKVPNYLSGYLTFLQKFWKLNDYNSVESRVGAHYTVDT